MHLAGVFILGISSSFSSGSSSPLKYVRDTFIDEYPVALYNLVIEPVRLKTSIAPECLNVSFYINCDIKVTTSGNITNKYLTCILQLIRVDLKLTNLLDL